MKVDATVFFMFILAKKMSAASFSKRLTTKHFFEFLRPDKIYLILDTKQKKPARIESSKRKFDVIFSSVETAEICPILVVPDETYLSWVEQS